MSSRAIAELCGVSHMTVQRMMPDQLEQSSTSRTGTDGKQYPATRRPRISTPEDEEAKAGRLATKHDGLKQGSRVPLGNTGKATTASLGITRKEIG